MVEVKKYFDKPGTIPLVVYKEILMEHKQSCFELARYCNNPHININIS